MSQLCYIAEWPQDNIISKRAPGSGMVSEFSKNLLILSLRNSYDQKNNKEPKDPLGLVNSLQIFVYLGFYDYTGLKKKQFQKGHQGSRMVSEFLKNSGF